MRNPFLRKPIGSLSCTSSSSDAGGEEGIARHMTLQDLVFLGLGGTIGSGIFVLSGQIARNQAGAATPICFLISGVCAVLSGCCYAELSANIPGEEERLIRGKAMVKGRHSHPSKYFVQPLDRHTRSSTPPAESILRCWPRPA